MAVQGNNIIHFESYLTARREAAQARFESEEHFEGTFFFRPVFCMGFWYCMAPVIVFQAPSNVSEAYR